MATLLSTGLPEPNEPCTRNWNKTPFSLDYCEFVTPTCLRRPTCAPGAVLYVITRYRICYPTRPPQTILGPPNQLGEAGYLGGRTDQLWKKQILTLCLPPGHTVKDRFKYSLGLFPPTWHSGTYPIYLVNRLLHGQGSNKDAGDTCFTDIVRNAMKNGWY